MSSRRVAVVGGGLAGLAASVSLADLGFQVSLFERSPRLGGRATSYSLSDGECIDNCQHVTLRCCTNLEDFYRRIGATKKIRYYNELVFSARGARRGVIGPSRLPAPFHLAYSFARFPLLPWKDKAGIARAMLKIMRCAGKLPSSVETTMLDWLRRQRQTQNAIDRFWRTVLVSALNEDLERMDAAYGVAVFWKAFLSNPEGFAIGIPSVPLSDLYDIRSDRIDVHTGHGVAEMHLRSDKVTGIRLDDGSEVRADYYVAATTFNRLSKMLPAGSVGLEEIENFGRVQDSPITSVHLWFDREVMTEPFIALLDQTIQWVFNKTLLCPPPSRNPGQYLQIVISASRALSERSQPEIVDLCRKELVQVIPATGQATLKRSIVIRENAATFSPQPGCDQWRPASQTRLGNLFLAGDWTKTGWPATMEGAVRSGYLAAEAIVAANGGNARLIQPELRPTGLARFHFLEK